MILTALSFVVIAVLGVIGLGVLLLPVYVWMQHRDAMAAPQRAADLAEAQALLAETAPA
ncbi:MAG: hypothetical protein KJ856_22405 [Gammaproteobacteria bacterium]|uniref:Uncharacterized protein n=1 Tax=viral metagenome TaxID=1070528 RepID=A0A6M3KMQ8_9ZZZZ|nr:hypothetical protein [Gammaproteobacteria bacterium]MBU1505954.1 hypothetical protein [Gammaproteobacteria bacterium]MBU2119882.1 hypothetical protein [Gammaproteobacteria bacterium]MBU2189740.1 hypothetical protein [Gammaproteobacteria bacterium]